eukprot:scaffold20826_cov73-Attheya_sp.AAC.5
MGTSAVSDETEEAAMAMELELVHTGLADAGADECAVVGECAGAALGAGRDSANGYGEGGGEGSGVGEGGDGVGDEEGEDQEGVAEVAADAGTDPDEGSCLTGVLVALEGYHVRKQRDIEDFRGNLRAPKRLSHYLIVSSFKR